MKSVSVKVPESKAGMCKFTKLLHAWAHSKKHLVWLQSTPCVVLKKSSVMLINPLKLEHTETHMVGPEQSHVYHLVTKHGWLENHSFIAN